MDNVRLQRRCLCLSNGISLQLLQDPTASKEPRSGGEQPPFVGITDPRPALNTTINDGHLGSVGLATWQCGVVLADHLLRFPPFKQWHDVRVVDLGTGTGVVGLALALSGADVVLCDLPHITPLTQMNMQDNCDPGRHRAQVVDYVWGQDPPPPLLTQPPPDILVGADLVYSPAEYPALLRALCTLVAPHTLLFLALKLRGNGEEGFLEDLSREGFVVEGVRLHGERYSEDCGEVEGGTYRLVRACRLA